MKVILAAAAIFLVASATPTVVESPSKPAPASEEAKEPETLATLRSPYRARIIGPIVQVAYARNEGQETSDTELRVVTRRYFGKGNDETWFCKAADVPREDEVTISWNAAHKQYQLGDCKPKK